eukprot:c22138_g2_i1 orf=314-820(-)
MHASNLLQAVLKPRHFSSSDMHSTSSSKRNNSNLVNDPCPARQTCLCSPTTHLGSFRCRLHRAPLQQRDHHSASSEDVNPTVSNVPSKQTTLVTAVIPNSQLKMPPIAKDGKRCPSTVNHLSRSVCRKFEARPSRLSRVIMAENPDYEKKDIRELSKLSIKMATVHLA